MTSYNEKIVSGFKNFIKISFVRDVGILQTGKFFSVFLGGISSVALARLLQPGLYGIYGLIFAFVGLIGIFIDWGGSYASLTLLAEAYARKDKEEIKNILTYFVKITLLAIVIIGVLSIIFAPFLTDLIYQNSQIGQWARIILVAVFIGIFYNLLVIVLQSLRKIKKLAILELFNKVAYLIFPVGLLWVGFGLAGVIWGHFISSFIFLILSLLIYSSLAQKKEYLPFLKEIFLNFKEIKIGKYFKFGFLIAIDKNIGRLLSLLPVLILGYLASPAEIGYFKIALGYIMIPVMMFSPISRILNVQLPKSKTYGVKVLENHFFKTALYSGFIAILLVIPFIFLSPFLIKLFYGPEYTSSISLTYYLFILTVLSGFSVGLSAFYRAVDKMKISVISGFGQIIMIMLLTFTLIKFYSPLMAVVLSLVISAFLFSVLNFLIIKIILNKRHDQSFIN
ncbi:oligosaccharide flippase family protein [Patescibacteria group bacterium]|nr:oligosaccharide flippase family protein [Patescibacteria group bacterium]